MKLSRGPLIAVSSVLGLGLIGGGTAAAIALDKDTVTITADGQVTTVSTRANDVAALLQQQGITVGQRDVVQPALNTRITDGSAVTILYARPVTLTVDGKKTTRWTTATTVKQALAQFQLDGKDNIVSTNRSTPLGRQGLSLSVITPKQVSVTIAKGTRIVEVPSNATLAEALKKAGVTIGKRDIVQPAATTPVAKAAKVTYKDVHERPVIVKESLPFTTVEKDDPDLPKGERKTVTQGVKGEKQSTINQVYVDGKLVSNHFKLAEKVTRKPVNQVVAVGTKEPEPVVEPTSEPTSEPTAEPTAAEKRTTPSRTTPRRSTSQQTSAPEPEPAPVQPRAGGVSGSCEASNYWEDQMTANGESFDPNAMTAAHKTLPFGTMLRVTNVANGKSVVVRINDRGPYIGGRCLDLSKGAFLQIAPESAGVAQVTYTQV